MGALRQLVIPVVTISILILNGCGATLTGSSPGTTSATPATTAGAPAPTPPPTPAPPPAPPAPAPLPAPALVYAGLDSVGGGHDSGYGTIFGYRFDPTTGSLTQIVGWQGGPDHPIVMESDPSGRFLYVANGYCCASEPMPNGFAYDIDPASAALNVMPGAPFDEGNQVASVAVHPSGKFVYFATNDGVRGFTIDPATGSLTAMSGSPFHMAPGQYNVDLTVALAIDPTGQHLYAVNVQWSSPSSGATDSIWTFSIDSSSGALSHVESPVPLPQTAQPNSEFASLLMHPSGRYLYSFDSNGMRAFSIASDTGAISAMNAPTVPAGNAAVFDSTYTFLYTILGDAQIGPNTIAIYRVQSDGSLVTAASPFAPVLKANESLAALLPAGNYVLALTSGEGTDPSQPWQEMVWGNILTLSVNPQDGGLTLSSQLPLPTSERGMSLAGVSRR